MVDFLRRIKDFRRQADLLSGQLQGYQFGLDMLNNVFAVREILEPFLANIPASQNAIPQPMSLNNFCLQIHAQLSRFNEAELNRRLDKITNVLNHLEEIRVWFSKAEGLTLGMGSHFVVLWLIIFQILSSHLSPDSGNLGTIRAILLYYMGMESFFYKIGNTHLFAATMQDFRSYSLKRTLKWNGSYHRRRFKTLFAG